MPTQGKQQNNTPTMPDPNSNNQGESIHNYRLKNEKFMVNLVANFFSGETPELFVVMELFSERMYKETIL